MVLFLKQELRARVRNLSCQEIMKIEKLVQVIEYILNKTKSRRMQCMKLMKLLYYCEREAFDKLGQPIIDDSYVSMKHGPVLSATLNLIRRDPDYVNTEDQSYWDDHFKTHHKYLCRITDSYEQPDELSVAETDIIDSVFYLHGHKNMWVICGETHRLPEWKNPGESSIPLSKEEILRALDKSDEEISAILEDLKIERDSTSWLNKKKFQQTI